MNPLIGKKTVTPIDLIRKAHDAIKPSDKQTQNSFDSVFEQKITDKQTEKSLETLIGEMDGTRNPAVPPPQESFLTLAQKMTDSLRVTQGNMNELVNRLHNKEHLDSQEILRIQKSIMQCTRDFETAFKIVEQIVGAVKTVFQTQV